LIYLLRLTERFNESIEHKASKLNKLQERFKSKKELFNFLTQEGHAYLPKLESTNIYFFKQVLKGEKEVTTLDLLSDGQCST